MSEEEFSSTLTRWQTAILLGQNSQCLTTASCTCRLHVCLGDLLDSMETKTFGAPQGHASYALCPHSSAHHAGSLQVQCVNLQLHQLALCTCLHPQVPVEMHVLLQVGR